MVNEAVYHNLQAALAQPGCPVCRLAQQAVHDYLKSVLYESVNDIKTRDRLRAAQGFCRRHAWLLPGFRDPLAIAIIYRDVANQAGKDLAAAAAEAGGVSVLRLRGSRAGKDAAHRLAPHRSCPACAIAESSEKMTLTVLLLHLASAELQSAYTASAGLCLPHLRQGLGLANSDEEVRALAALQQQVYDRLIGELDEFIRKHDYRFRHEEMGRERDAPRRAIAATVGEDADSDLR